MTYTETATYTMDAAELRDACTILARVATSRHGLPVLAGIRTGGGNLTASDLDTFATIRTSGTMPDAVIPAALLRDTAKACKVTKRAPIALHFESGFEEITVLSPNGASTLRTMPADEYPLYPHATDGTVVHAATIAAMGEVAWAASTDMARPILTTVCYSGTEVAATDSYRLSTKPACCVAPTPILVPARAFKLIGQLVKQYGPVEGAMHDGTWLTVTGARWTVTVRLVDAEFPKYAGLFPGDADYTTVATFTPEAVAWIKARNVDKYTPVRVHCHDGIIRLVYRVQDVGESILEHAGAYTGHELEVAFDPRKFAQQLEHDGTTVHLVNALKPATFDAGAGRGLLMPVRVD